MEDDGACPNVRFCELFPRLRTDGALEHCLEEYCHADYSRCARYQSSLQRIRPPTTLLPDGRHLRDPVDDKH